MADFGPADAKQDAQNFHASRPLYKLWIQAGSSLLDKREVKSRSVSDCLQELRVTQIGIRPRDRGVLVNGKGRDRVGKFIPEIRITFARAVASPEIGVNRKLREIRQTPEAFVRTGGLARWQSAESSRSTVSAPFDARYAFKNTSWLSSSSVLSEMYWSMSPSSCLIAPV